MSSYTAERLKELRLDGGKMLFRIDPDRNSRYSISTIYARAKAVEECDKLGLEIFMEPLPVRQQEGGYVVEMTADALIKAVGVATGARLSARPQGMWIKTPLRRRVPPGGTLHDAAHSLAGWRLTGNPWG